jgi:hypothetical protein
VYYIPYYNEYRLPLNLRSTHVLNAGFKEKLERCTFPEFTLLSMKFRDGRFSFVAFFSATVFNFITF